MLDLSHLNKDQTFSILVIDDVTSIRVSLIEDIQSLGFTGKFLEADTLSSSLEILNSSTFNLVFCDRNLPDGSGVNFLLALRGHSNLSSVPVIMCTTVSEIALITYAISMGANEYITKPWTKELLLKKILAVL